MPRLISSQRYRDDEIVAQKSASRDYVVTVSPSFEIDGESLCVILDGHHSLLAANRDGVDPEIVVATATDNDAVCLLDRGDIDGFLAAVQIDDEYYYLDSGSLVW